ncbi:MAG: hypothetical protein ACI9R3_001699 [Verrucomicrobiales bacterium]|jgi:hypothetical protein
MRRTGLVFFFHVMLSLFCEVGSNVAAGQEISEQERARLLVQSEELLGQLRPAMHQLDSSAMRLKIPGAVPVGMFSDEVEVIDISREPTPEEETFSIPGIIAETWPPQHESNVVNSAELKLWEMFFSKIDTLERAHFYAIDADFPNPESLDSLRNVVGFEGVAKLKDGRWCSIVALQELRWEKSGDDWRIAAWLQREFSTKISPARLFREVLEEALPKPEDYQRARFSYHEQNIIRLFTDGQVTLPKPLHVKYPNIDSLFQHPALSVVDIDRDGFDDIYLMGRWGRNMLLRNMGDATFEDIAPEIGLDIEGMCNSALFADYDNDGDSDLFLGRSLERTLYLENINGVFKDSSKKVAARLPYLVSTISAADFNNDGLLDVFLGLYGPTSPNNPIEVWARDFFPKAFADVIIAKSKNSHRYLEHTGPPNLLLVNRGDGQFGVAPETEQLAEWLHTFQGAWADYDDDGDQDIYICNDFGGDHLFRNELQPSGKVSFTNVTSEVTGEIMGFGMGASWGDYDRDGDLDLYVSNMFSKAGRRITSRFKDLDPRIYFAAEGNHLFKNEDGARFSQVAGLNEPAMRVAKVGWAFGGQFFDADNDAWPDIYCPSGFYTAPKEIASDADL